MEKLRLEYALDATAQALRRDPRAIVTNRTGSRDKDGRKEDWNEVVTRDKPPNVQLVKTFLRVTQELGKLNEREIVSNPVGENLTQCRMFQAIADLLSEWRDGERIRKNPPSDAFLSMVQVFKMNIRRWIFYFRQGWSAKDAWPLPIRKQPAAPASESADLADNCINRPAPEINLGLTTTGVDSAGATSAACRS